MKKIVFLFLLAVLGLSSGTCIAMEVTEAVIAIGLTDRRPVDAGESFPVSVGRLYCFTEVTGASAGAAIEHVWYREGKEMARIELPIRSAHWRTWSSKNLLPEWTGKWAVKVFDRNGKLLAVIPFTLY